MPGAGHGARMPGSLPILLVCGVSLLCNAFPAAASAQAFNLTEVAPGVLVHRGRHAALDDPGRGDSANIGFIVGERCVAVIDTGGSIATGRELRAAIAAHTPLPVCYVINTHAHFDHVLGNAAFAGTGAVFVGHAKLPGALAASRDYFETRFAPELAGAPAGPAVVVPERLVGDELRIDLGQRELLLQAHPQAHTAADLTVLDLKTDTLWTGDLVFMERLPVLDGKLLGWLRWMDDVEARQFARIIPGHGPASAAWPAAAAPQHAYLAALRASARAAVAAGKFLEDAVAEARAAQITGWVIPEPHARNFSKAYREVEWE